MARLFSRLRKVMVNVDADADVLARKLGVSKTTISKKLNGHTQWKLDEMYTVLDLLGRPASDLPVLFPPSGQNEEECSRGNAAGAGRRVAQGLQKGAERR